MNHSQIKELMESFSTLSVDELEFEDGTVKLALRKHAAPVQVVQAVQQSPPVQQAPAVQALAPQTAAAPAAPAALTATAPVVEGHIVKSPIVGTFYRAPGPGQKEFVSVGDRVTKGQVLCIVEAMKVMNTIESDTAGEVVEILLEAGTPVEFGTGLIRIRT